MKSFPMADASNNEYEKKRIIRVLKDRAMVGAANTTKWNELITFMREKNEWRPSYRYKTVEGYISGWDVEWLYHLPFPFIGVEWFDIGLVQNISVGRLVEDTSIDHSQWIVGAIKNIGFEHQVSGDVVRIWGYFPKSYEDFPPQ